MDCHFVNYRLRLQLVTRLHSRAQFASEREKERERGKSQAGPCNGHTVTFNDIVHSPCARRMTMRFTIHREFTKIASSRGALTLGCS